MSSERSMACVSGSTSIFQIHGGLVWLEVHATFPLLLLKFEGDAANWSTLDPLHEVCDVSSDFVPHPLGLNDGNILCDLLVCLEIQGQLAVVLLNNETCGLLYCLGSYATHGDGGRTMERDEIPPM